MKRKLTVISVIILVVALLSAGTYALTTVEDTARNIVTAGGIDFEILERTDGGDPFPVNGIQILPGDTVSKVVTVHSICDHPMYVRVRLTKDVDNELLTAEDRFSMNINTAAWEYKDGYYYCKTALAPHEETAPLFTEVHIDGESVDNSYLGATFLLDITGYAVQSENNGQSVFDATGWPEDN